MEPNELLGFFGITRGVTAWIGGGGKTSMLLWLSGLLKAHGSVIVCTSTHIFPPAGMPLFRRVNHRLRTGECIAVGTPEDSGKLTAPEQSFSTLIGIADYVLCEADGSKGLPLKAHAGHEPVIPPESGVVLAVLGLDGIGKPIREAAHRPELYASKLGVSIDTPVSPALAAAMLNSYPRVTGYVLNKADTPLRLACAREIASLLNKPAAITTMQPEVKLIELWRNGICWLS